MVITANKLFEINGFEHSTVKIPEYDISFEKFISITEGIGIEFHKDHIYVYRDEDDDGVLLTLPVFKAIIEKAKELNWM